MYNCCKIIKLLLIGNKKFKYFFIFCNLYLMICVFFNELSISVPPYLCIDIKFTCFDILIYC